MSPYLTHCEKHSHHPFGPSILNLPHCLFCCWQLSYSTILSFTGPGNVIQVAGQGASKLILPKLVDTPGMTREQIMISAVSIRPTAVYFYVAGSFMNYRSGIYDPAMDCSPTNWTINHGMVVVGYNLTVPVPYWIVRNSWNKG